MSRASRRAVGVPVGRSERRLVAALLFVVALQGALQVALANPVAPVSPPVWRWSDFVRWNASLRADAALQADRPHAVSATLDLRLPLDAARLARRLTVDARLDAERVRREADARRRERSLAALELRCRALYLTESAALQRALADRARRARDPLAARVWADRAERDAREAEATRAYLATLAPPAPACRALASVPNATDPQPRSRIGALERDAAALKRSLLDAPFAGELYLRTSLENSFAGASVGAFPGPVVALALGATIPLGPKGSTAPPEVGVELSPRRAAVSLSFSASSPANPPPPAPEAVREAELRAAQRLERVQLWAGFDAASDDARRAWEALGRREATCLGVCAPERLLALLDARHRSHLRDLAAIRAARASGLSAAELQRSAAPPGERSDPGLRRRVRAGEPPP